MYSLICVICNKTFEAEHFNYKYCSDDCRKIGLAINSRKAAKKSRDKKRKKIYKICKYCCNKFETSNSIKIFCKKRCHQLFENERKKRRNKEKKEELKCTVCGKIFIKSNKHRKYCSIECRKKRNVAERKKYYRDEDKKKKIKEYQKQYRKKIRAKLKKREYDYNKRFKENNNIDYNYLEKLYNETKFCPKCGIELNEIQNNPRQKTLEHIVHLSNGGKHINENIMFICRKCNTKESHKN